MEIQSNGANAITIDNKHTKIVIDDNLKELGLNSITKSGDVSVFTAQTANSSTDKGKLLINCPGEYEIGNLSIYGIAARSHMDTEDKQTAVIYKILTGDLCVVVTGHIYPELSDSQLEAIGMVDILLIPIGGHGYTMDALGALKLIREIEPKLVIPTHYADKDIKYPVPQDTLEDVLKVLAMEPKDRANKLKVKSSDLADSTQLFVLDRA